MGGQEMSGRFSHRVRRERAELVAREAARLLRDEGCFRVRVDRVAHAAGVGKGTVYLDHRDKVGLTGASLGVACRDLGTRIDHAVEGSPDPQTRLAGVVEVLIRAVADRPDLGALLERRLPCAARWLGADERPYARLLARLGAAVGPALDLPARRLGGGLVAEALLGILSMPSWQRLARERPSDAVRALLALVSGPGTDGGATKRGARQATDPERSARSPR